MGTQTQFECCRCHESFTYDPAPRIRQCIDQFQMETQRRPAVVVECPHCAASLYLDLTDSSVHPFEDVQYDVADAEGVFWDLTPAKRVKAQELNG